MAVKILSSAQIKQLDRYTIENDFVASIDLMERACNAFVEWFTKKFQSQEKIAVVCGVGNNGGDGLGIARMLHESGYTVEIFIVSNGGSETEEFKINLERLPSAVKQTTLSNAGPIEALNVSFLIDAIFGSGLSRKPSGIFESVINAMNAHSAAKISVDIPSGLYADQHSDGAIVEADFTVSFQLPKLAFMVPENAKYVGEWNVVDIGLSDVFIQQAATNYHWVEADDVKQLLRPRKKFSHKGNYGHGLLIAGSLGKIGAATLAARAALRSGIGLLTVATPKCGFQILQHSVPEAMVLVDEHESYFTTLPSEQKYNGLGIGPGLGTHQETYQAFTSLLKQFRQPMVLDADALNLMSMRRDLLSIVPNGSILTPHPKEFERLVGTWQNDFERLEKQRQLSRQLDSVIILKGANSSISFPNGSVYFNSTGNPGMATGGSGDVLTGILTGLMCQGYTADDAAMIGVYAHGLAGDLAAQELGMQALIASDIINYLPKAFKTFE